MGLYAHAITNDGNVLPSVVCPLDPEPACGHCRFHDMIRLIGWATPIFGTPFFGGEMVSDPRIQR